MNLSRRDFTRLSALGLAAQLAPKLPAQSSGRKIGYAIIGLGRIADHFMRGIQETSNSKVVALVSGHPDKAAKIAEQYGVPKSSIYNYQNMDTFRDNHAIDAVYVALPNSMHAEYTIRSAKAGKHVLCEKPMAVNPTECEAMISACKAANVKLMIAYRCHYETTNLAAVKLIRDGALGQLQQIQSAFGFNCGAGEWRLDKAMAGGGPLMDVGIYCLNATRYLTGEEPSGFSAYTSTDTSDPRFKTVEENLSWITKFPSGVVASCNTTYGAPMDGYFRVYGSKGWLEVNPAFIYDGLVLKAEYRDANGKFVKLDQPNPEKDPIHFTKEAIHFSDCILNNREPKTPGEEGLRDLKYMREIYRSAGLKMNA
ncbi:MAG TPA: Gfo/Idh/MocA family oxidoreductase [Acidobacteriaceae bacterium]|jgi:predicted dehydrogenase|nr:Gfo/Idh/MocA family oxidoreductase [Acidobacteriaceae bacterium]